MTIFAVDDFFNRYAIDWEVALTASDCSKFSKVIVCDLNHLRQLEIGDNGRASNEAIQKLREMILDWCQNNCTGEYAAISKWRAVGFESDADAFMFELRWG